MSFALRPGILKLYAKCSAERLFLPWVLRDEDAAIYLDTDLFFMRPPEDLWQYYRQMDGDDIFGAVVMDGYYEQRNIKVRYEYM